MVTIADLKTAEDGAMHQCVAMTAASDGNQKSIFFALLLGALETDCCVGIRLWRTRLSGADKGLPYI